MFLKSNRYLFNRINGFIIYSCRLNLRFIKLWVFYKSFTISSPTIPIDIHGMFSDVYRLYAENLRNSTSILKLHSNLKISKQPLFYNYIILRASTLSKVVTLVDENNSNVTPKILQLFKKCCIYVGKGTHRRKFQHILNARSVNTRYTYNEICIRKLWESFDGITLFQFPNEVDHFEAHSREFALIKTIGLENLNNIINGTPFGNMKFWSDVEINNFGLMMLYNAIKSCVNDPLTIIYN